jgi:hypothetical protein
MTQPANSLTVTPQPGNYTVKVRTDGTSVLVPSGQAPPTAIFNVTSERAFNTPAQNVRGQSIGVSGYATTAGSSVGNIATAVGPTSGSLGAVWENEATATESGGAAGFVCFVPAGYWYTIIPAGAVTGLALVVETLI